MKRRIAMSLVVAFIVVGCSVLGQKSAQKPVGAHYSAAFINSSGGLIVFPFDGNAVKIDLPATLAARVRTRIFLR